MIERQTPEIDKLAAALAKAQGVLEGATKDAVNPHFKSHYADLSAVVAAIRKPFADNGLSYHQGPRDFGGEIRMVTRILHSSGQWLEDDGFPMLVDKQNMQGLGSATTYARRYGLSAACGIAPEDDDGNAAVGNGGKDAKPITSAGVPATSGDGDLWGGPLSKTAFKATLREFVSELEGCSEEGELLALLNTEDNQAIITQCTNDAPTWFYGQDGSDVEGLEARIKRRREEVLLQAPLGKQAA